MIFFSKHKPIIILLKAEKIVSAAARGESPLPCCDPPRPPPQTVPFHAACLMENSFYITSFLMFTTQSFVANFFAASRFIFALPVCFSRRVPTIVFLVSSNLFTLCRALCWAPEMLGFCLYDRLITYALNALGTDECFRSSSSSVALIELLLGHSERLRSFRGLRSLLF